MKTEDELIAEIIGEFQQDADLPTAWCEFCGTPDTEICNPGCASWKGDE